MFSAISRRDPTSVTDRRLLHLSCSGMSLHGQNVPHYMRVIALGHLDIIELTRHVCCEDKQRLFPGQAGRHTEAWLDINVDMSSSTGSKQARAVGDITRIQLFYAKKHNNTCHSSSKLLSIKCRRSRHYIRYKSNHIVL